MESPRERGSPRASSLGAKGRGGSPEQKQLGERSVGPWSSRGTKVSAADVFPRCRPPQRRPKPAKLIGGRRNPPSGDWLPQKISGSRAASLTEPDIGALSGLTDT